MGSPKKPNAKQLDILKDTTLDKALVEKKVTVGADGVFRMDLDTRQNDVILMELVR